MTTTETNLQHFGFEEIDTIQALNRRMEKLESDRTSMSKPNESRTNQNGKKRNTTGKLKDRCYICQSPNHYFSKCPIYMKCKDEMNNQSGNKGFNDNNKGGSANRSFQHRNQGNFNTPLTH